MRWQVIAAVRRLRARRYQPVQHATTPDPDDVDQVAWPEIRQPHLDPDAGGGRNPDRLRRRHRAPGHQRVLGVALQDGAAYPADIRPDAIGDRGLGRHDPYHRLIARGERRWL